MSGDACPNCGVWLGNEPLPNDSAWARQQAEIERLRAELRTEWGKIERLRAAGDALAEAFEALRDEHDACWCPDPRTEMPGTCQLCAAEQGWEEARRG